MSECFRCGNDHDEGTAKYKHKLIGLLCLNRAYRPDEWEMDEFIREAKKLEVRAEAAEAALDRVRGITWEEIQKAIDSGPMNANYGSVNVHRLITERMEGK